MRLRLTGGFKTNSYRCFRTYSKDIRRHLIVYFLINSKLSLDNNRHVMKPPIFLDTWKFPQPNLSGITWQKIMDKLHLIQKCKFKACQRYKRTSYDTYMSEWSDWSAVSSHPYVLEFAKPDFYKFHSYLFFRTKSDNVAFIFKLFFTNVSIACELLTLIWRIVFW